MGLSVGIYFTLILLIQSTPNRMKVLQIYFDETLVSLSLAATNMVSIDFPSFSYSNVSVPWV